MDVEQIMTIQGLRNQARIYFRLHYANRQAFLESWADWKKARGDSVTEQILFSQESRAVELVEDEQMYCRFAHMYATMAIMEMMWKGVDSEEQ